MTTLDYDWLTEMNVMADKAENDHSHIKDMTNEQLCYLVYWNWGYSGSNVLVTTAAINELAVRGIENYNEIGESINEAVEQYY